MISEQLYEVHVSLFVFLKMKPLLIFELIVFVLS